MSTPNVSILMRRRDATSSSIKRIGLKLDALEGQEHNQSVVAQAQQLSKRLEQLDGEFKTHHFAILDLTKKEENLATEQRVLDDHEDEIDDLSIRIQALMAPFTTAPHIEPSISDRAVYQRRSAQLQARLTAIKADVDKLTANPSDAHLVCLYQEHLADLKRELSGLRKDVLVITADLSDPLMSATQRQEDSIFEMSVQVKKLMFTNSGHLTAVPTARSESHIVKLPRLEVPTFDGELLHWKTFWEQFDVSVHSRTDISATEKLVYLRHSLKDGSAKGVIEGLSNTGDQYEEAITTLKERFDRPRVIHQAHVQKVCEVPSLKDGTGKDIRKFHDVVQQHLRALKAMGEDPKGSFITALLELKLDKETMFEWQKYSQATEGIPHYDELLKFLNLRAQASETCPVDIKKCHPKKLLPKAATSLVVSADATPNCSLCKTQKHPLHACPQFKTLPHERMLSTVRSANVCLNCLKPGHFSKNCVSSNRCKKCHRPHHTLLHSDKKEGTDKLSNKTPPSSENPESKGSHVAVTPMVLSTVQTGVGNTLLMTCQMLVHAPDGTPIRARGLLDSGSSVSFISERLAQTLKLPLNSRHFWIHGITGLANGSPLQSVATFQISSLLSSTERLSISAVVVPRVTQNLPSQPVPFNDQWNHLVGIHLADIDFGQPSQIDILLGADVFSDILLNGRRTGPPNAPVAFETKLGWVLTGKITEVDRSSNACSHHVITLSGDDILHKFWETEECPNDTPPHTPEEKAVIQHFNKNHTRAEDGRFIVPLPKKLQSKPLGESRSCAVRRFLSLERSLHSKNQFNEFAAVMKEYVDLNHAELVPECDANKPVPETFYLPMHAVHKAESTTTKLRVVFDASAKSSSGVSLNDCLLVGPTVHPPLIDVLLRFRTHRVALTTDVSKMYRAVQLISADRDLHRFVWRDSPKKPLLDYRMTRVTFGVAASSFAANMAVRQNSLDHKLEYPLAAKSVEAAFYVDDGLTGADTIQEAIALQRQLQELFAKGGFLLRKWNSSDPRVIEHLTPDLKDANTVQRMPSTEEYTKALGIRWNTRRDCFRLSVHTPKDVHTLTKRILVSEVAKTFDVLGWFSPSIIIAKMLMQKLWEFKIGWDDTVPEEVQSTWLRWKNELHLLSDWSIPRCYFDKSSQVQSMEIHGFSDASESAYAAVVYIRVTDVEDKVHTSLIMSKTKVAPIKKLTVPRLELCGAKLVAQLVHHIRKVLDIPLSCVHTWTDSTIVLNWLDGNPRRYKTYVGNRIAAIIDLIPPDKWRHVRSADNPADCASRGIYPSELLHHSLWWHGPSWLRKPLEQWPEKLPIPQNDQGVDSKEMCLLTVTQHLSPVIPFERYSSFSHLKRITSWVLRFIHNCKTPRLGEHHKGHLASSELQEAEQYWIKLMQLENFNADIESLKARQFVSKHSSLLTLHPFLDDHCVLRVGGRKQLSQTSSYSSKHPIIVHGKHPITHLIIQSEHLRQLHAGPTLLSASLYRRFHIVGGRKIIRSITRKCVTCRRYTARPNPQMLGQLPVERITQTSVFNKVGVDYAGPFTVKYGYVRKPTLVKAYVCVFVCLAVKAVHLELVTDLTSEAFIACLKWFISRRGLPVLIWSDNGSNFKGAAREMKELYQFLKGASFQEKVNQFLSNRTIEWKFIPQHAPHFGGIWESAVKSMKVHLRKIMGEVKMTYEELSTLLVQIEACLNSRPLVPLPNDDDGIEALTPGHFLIGQPLTALPDLPKQQPISLLKRWDLCKSLLQHFWKRWSLEYVAHLGRFNKWHHPTRNIRPGDLVVIHEDSVICTQWPLARVIEVYPGRDNLVRVAKVKTVSGQYVRPVTKLALILPNDEHQARPMTIG